ncbi:FHA domain-containing protein [Leifsonia sp. NPDC058248]|uniref:FHA domain-containing protein n=1 Tax=Leifsonia sp. NPDC058248 TaxID=3346402 RepID=UPI0036D782B5
MTPGFTRYAPSGAPSRWLFVAGLRFVAVFDSTVSDEILDSVWWLARSELATIESVVGAFPLTGPDAVRSFAVAELGEPNAANEVLVTAVVRGSAAIDVFSVGGSRRFTAAGVQPWVLAEFRSVTGLVLGGDDLPTAPVARAGAGSLPLGSGVVDGELLAWSSTPIPSVPRTPSVQKAADAPDARGAVESAAPIDDTVIRARGGASLFGHGGAEAAVGADALHAGAEPASAPHELPGAVDIEPPSDTPESRASWATDAEPPATQPDPVVLPPGRFAIRVGSGDILALDVPVLIGRRPAPLRVASGAEPRLIAVPSPEHQVSSTHVLIEQSGDAVVITDLRSTNGTTVTPAGGPTARMRPGQSLVVLPGTRVEIGDGNIIEITAAPGES